MEYGYELFVKNDADLRMHLQHCKKLDVRTIGIVDKKGFLPTADVIQEISHSYSSSVSIVPHYSITNHYHRELPKIAAELSVFCKQVEKYGVTEVLLVSGAAERKYTTVEVLQYFAHQYEHIISFAVAFNPYLQGDALLAEQMRLKEKIATGLVNTVYFQIGDSVNAFNSGVDFVRELDTTLSIAACLLLPDNTFLQRFRFRPWRGVVLSELFLSSEVRALKQAEQLYLQMEEQNVVPYIEMMRNNVPDFLLDKL